MTEASTTGGSATSATSSNFHDTTASTVTDPKSSNEFETNMSRPIWTSSANESMSDVNRLTTTPAFCRSSPAQREPLEVVEAPEAEVAEEPLADPPDHLHLEADGEEQTSAATT